MLLILTFVPQETRPLLRHFHSARPVLPNAECRRLGVPHAWAGDFAEVPAAIATVGVGAASAVAGFGRLRQSLEVSAVAVCGLAGALAPALAVADLLVAEFAVNEQGERVRAESGARALPALAVPFRSASLLSVERVLVTAAEKAALASSADAADMETFAIARAAAAAALPWCALRAVSDTAAEDLPLDFNRCASPSGQVAIAAILRELAGRPTALLGHVDGALDAEAEADFLCQVNSHLRSPTRAALWSAVA